MTALFGAVAAVAIAAPPRIRRVRIETENVFEEGKSSFLFRAADLLHTVTREDFVRRELLFAEGAPLDLESIAETERNLRAYPFFRSVQIRIEPAGDDEVDVVVQTQDSWTTQLSGSIGRDGGGTRASVTLEENNFLGRGRKLALSLGTDPDRTSREVRYFDPHLAGRRLALELLYGSSSDGERRRVALSRAFRSLEDDWTGSLEWEDGSREVPIYRGGEEASRFGIEGSFLEAFLARRYSERERRPVFRLGAGYRRESVSYLTIAPEPAPPPPGRRFGFLFARAELLEPNFVTQRNVGRLSRIEDFDVGRSAALEVGYSPAVAGAVEAFEGRLSLSQGWTISGGFLRASIAASGRSRAGVLENALAGADLFGMWRSQERSAHTLVARLRVDFGSRPDPESELAADGSTGLRGYRLHAFAGDRRVLANLEDRVRLTGEFLEFFQLGAAIFADAGYAWAPGAPIRLSDLRADLGVGLRLALTRAARHDLIRVDLAYPLRPDLFGRRGWQLSFSSSQAF
jgi:hypothetical protein